MIATGEVTVVIPTRNRLPYLQEAVRSVEEQMLRGCEVVVVDDASEDDTWSWLEGRRTDRIRCVRLESHGERSAARNRGLAECETEFVLFLDDDDRLTPFALERLVGELRTNMDAVAAIGGFEYFDEDGNRMVGPHTARRFKKDVWADAVFGWFVHSGRVLLRTDAVGRAGAFTPGLVVGEDRDLWLRVARLGPMILVPDVVLEHRIHTAQWRPRDVRTTEAEITMRHLQSVPTHDRRIGERIVDAKANYDDAIIAWDDLRYRDAVRLLFKLRRAPTSLLLSPLVRGSWFPIFWRALVASVIGPRAVQVVLKTKATARRVSGREAARWDVPFPQETGRDER